MEPDGISELEARKFHFQQWLERYRREQEMVPFVQMALENTEWSLEALRNRPAGNSPSRAVFENIREQNHYIENNLPLQPEYDYSAVRNISTLTVSGTANVFDYVAHLGKSDNPMMFDYSSEYTRRYQVIQVRQNRPGEVATLIGKLGEQSTIERFNRASRAYSAFKAHTGERTAAAFEARTLLDGVVGMLKERARAWPRENMTWALMADRLAKGGPGSVAHQELLTQEQHFSSLKVCLSQPAKDREGSVAEDLDDLWAQVLDRIYIVLSSIDL